MRRITVLDSSVSNRIAAGEVVERPASVVKELVENSIDAEARAITIEIKKGGISYIRVSDDGIGMDGEDAVVAFERHATSKIRTSEDLDNITTLGFRGEALSSICAVAQVELFSNTSSSKAGIHVVAKAGKIIKNEEIGHPKGTTVIVRNLFYNTPARMKFLKKDSTEAVHVSSIVEKFILGHPEISFRYINSGREVYFTPGDKNLTNCIYTLYGKDYAKSMLPLDYNMEGIRIKGMIGKAEIARPNRAMQNFFINGRYIKSKILTEAVEEAYKNMLTVNKFPAVVLHLDIHPTWVDVNVHPTKLEVKFSDEKQVYHAVYWAVKNALYAKKSIPEMVMPKQNLFEYHDDSSADPGTIQVSAEKVEQQNIYGIKKEAPVLNIEYEDSYIEAEQETFTSKGHKDYSPPVEHIGTSNTYHEEESFKVIGQIFNSYIIVQQNDDMLLIDQHAAHERIKFEELKKRYSSGELYSQVLLVPVVVPLSASEVEIIKDNKNFFDSIGFEVEDFGNNSIMIRQAPISVEQPVLKDLFIELVEMLGNTKNEKITETQSHALYTIACKAAVKANRPMHVREMEALVKNIMKLENINTCPHGRPIIISISKYYLEKQFKRIQ